MSIQFTPEPAFLKRLAEPFTITPNDIGRKFVASNGKTYLIESHDNDQSRYPILASDENGRKRWFTVSGLFSSGSDNEAVAKNITCWHEPTPTTNHPHPDEARNQREVLIRAFRNGERLTVLSAMKQYGVYALSQRVGDIIKSGVDVKKDWLDLPNKKRVRVYFMEGA